VRAVQIYFFPDFVQPSHGLLLMKVMVFDTACDAVRFMYVYGWMDGWIMETDEF